jgi:hypothetical protein
MEFACVKLRFLCYEGRICFPKRKDETKIHIKTKVHNASPSLRMANLPNA